MANQDAVAPEWVVRPGQPIDFPKIEPLWKALNEHQKGLGMFIGDAPNGFKDWSALMKAGLGRFSCLFVAELREEVIGYVAGWLKTLPSFQGGIPFGFLSELYVSPRGLRAARRLRSASAGHEHRSEGIGRVLLETGAQFFLAQGVTRVEGQVLPANVRAREAYKQWGWTEEMIQIVWHPSSR
jgi:hypothetical protein